jgi:hypothetical protein
MVSKPYAVCVSLRVNLCAASCVSLTTCATRAKLRTARNNDASFFFIIQIRVLRVLLRVLHVLRVTLASVSV